MPSLTWLSQCSQIAHESAPNRAKQGLSRGNNDCSFDSLRPYAELQGGTRKNTYGRTTCSLLARVNLTTSTSSHNGAEAS